MTEAAATEATSGAASADATVNLTLLLGQAETHFMHAMHSPELTTSL